MTLLMSIRRGMLRHTGWVLGVVSIAIVVGAVVRIGDLQAFKVADLSMVEDAAEAQGTGTPC